MLPKEAAQCNGLRLASVQPFSVIEVSDRSVELTDVPTSFDKGLIMNNLNEKSEDKAQAVGTSSTTTASLPLIGAIVRIDVAPVTIGEGPFEHVGFVSQRWKSR